MYCPGEPAILQACSICFCMKLRRVTEVNCALFPPVAQMTMTVMAIHADCKVVSVFMVNFPHIAVIFQSQLASTSIWRSKNKVLRTLSEGTPDPSCLISCSKRGGCQHFIRFPFRTGTLSTKFLKAEGKGRNYHLRSSFRCY